MIRFATQSATPPVAARNPKQDVVHGERREDDYFWLRDKGLPAVAAYLEAENAYADALMQPTQALQQALYDEMLARIQETDQTAPYLDHGFLYFSRTVEGLQYPIHCRRRDGAETAEQVLLDLNLLATGKPFLALGVATVSDDNRLLAYSTDDTGFRQYTLEVKDLEQDALLPLRIPKVVSACWAADNTTLFYTVEDDTKRSHRLYRHRLGSGEHTLVYEVHRTVELDAFRLELGLFRLDVVNEEGNVGGSAVVRLEWHRRFARRALVLEEFDGRVPEQQAHLPQGSAGNPNGHA